MYGFPHCYTKSLHPHSSNPVHKNVQLPLTNGKGEGTHSGLGLRGVLESSGRRPEGDWRWARRTVPPAMRSSFPHFLSFPFLSLPFIPFLLSSSPLLSPYLFVPLLFSLFTASHANSVRNPSPPSLPLALISLQPLSIKHALQWAFSDEFLYESLDMEGCARLLTDKSMCDKSKENMSAIVVGLPHGPWAEVPG